MPTYYLWTIGCQMNKAESEHLAAYLEGKGYRPVPAPHDADLVLMNTCVVRDNAEQRVLGHLGTLSGLKKRRPGMAIAVTGCFVDPALAGWKERFPQVDIGFAAGDTASFERWVQSRHAGAPEHVQVEATVRSGPAAFVPVMQGCNNFCSYCIVPHRRGRERSRTIDDVACEVERLCCAGTREVTLLGQNINSFGKDLPGKPDMATLLEKLNGLSGLERIRFLTSHPRDVDSRFIDAMARLDKVCECISLPVQAGDDRVLQAMRRGYTVEHYRELVAELRLRVPGIAVSTDVIVGFPGETEAEFLHTVELVRDLRFDTVHIAAYSPRQGTLAWKTLKDDVPAEEKERRLQAIESTQEKIASEINQGLVGQAVEVLVEGKSRDKWEGRTRSNKLVFFNDGSHDWTGRTPCLEVVSASPWSLQARLADVKAVAK